MVGSTQTPAPQAVTWAVGTVSHKGPGEKTVALPCQRGITADGLSAIEIVGDGSVVLSISFVAILPPNDVATVRRNAGMAEALLKKAAPAWQEAGAWLAGAMKELKATPRAKAHITPWTIDLTFEPRVNQLTLTIAR